MTLNQSRVLYVTYSLLALHGLTARNIQPTLYSCQLSLLSTVGREMSNTLPSIGYKMKA